MKRLSLRIVIFSSMMGALLCPAPGKCALVDEEPSGPIKILGDSVEYFFEEERAVGVGNIKIDHAGTKLSADRVEVDLKTKRAEAEGHVTVEQAGSLYKGEHVVMNFETGAAEISEMMVVMPPRFVGKGKHVRRHEDKHYVITEGVLTTCESAVCEGDHVPPYRISSREVEYYPENKVVMKHNVVWVYRIPVFYFPYLVIPIDIDQWPVQVQAGERDEWGKYVLTKTRYHENASFRGNVIFDYREKQGFAGGAEHFYDTEGLGGGAMRFYYADDQCAADDSSCSRSGTHTKPRSDRYRMQARHRWDIYRHTILMTEFNKLSDEFFIQDFFYRSEFEREPRPDNYVSLVHARENYTIDVLNRYRVNDFEKVVEKTPEIRLDTHTHPFGDTPFYYRQEVGAARLNLRYKNEDDLHAEAQRADLRHTLSYVWKIPPWTVTPFIASRETYYSRNESGNERDFVRWNTETGFDLSAKFWKLYDYTNHALGLDINQIRHIVTPNIDYFYQSEPTHVRDSLYTFDKIDSLENDSRFRFDLENKLQTRSHNAAGKLRPRTLVRSIVFVDYAVPQITVSRLEKLGLDADFYPYDWLNLTTDASYSFEEDEFQSATFDLVFHRGPVWLGLGQRYTQSSNQTTAQLDWKITDDLRVRLFERFEFEDKETDEFEAVIEIRNVLCWTLEITYNLRGRVAGDKAESIYFSLSPTNFPETAFRTHEVYPRKDLGISSSGVITSADY